MCICIYRLVLTHVEALEGQKRVLGPLKLELQEL